jgi:hypothetical protein
MRTLRSLPHRGLKLGLFLLMLTPASAPAEDLYFVTIYGAQRPIINQPRYTHTWVTLVHLCGAGCDPRTYRAESFTISWLSADLNVDPKKLKAQPGRNLTLQETLDWCAQNRMEVAQFGPYQCQPELYERMLLRWERLERGDMRYRASDLLNGRGDEVCNCIYAVLDIDGRDRVFRPVTLGFGQRGSAFVARRLSQFMIDDGRKHLWVNEMIGRENYPEIRRGVGGLLAP